MPTPVKKKAPATKAATPADPGAAKSRKFAADLMLDPCAHAAGAIEAYGKFMGEVDLALVMEGIVKQANIAHGPQQINNGPDQDGGGTRQPSPAHEKKPGRPNELLEVDNGQAWMVTGTPSAAGATDPSMATVGEGSGRENARRQSEIVA